MKQREAIEERPESSAEWIDRREFLGHAFLAFLSGVAVTVSGCGTTGGSSGTSDVQGAISGNHGHIAVITAAQLSQGQALVLSIQGNAAHNHTVSLSAQQVAGVRQGSTVSVVSGVGDGHTHQVTFN